MKTPRYRIGKICGTVALGAWILNPTGLAGQDLETRRDEPAPPPPRERQADKETPDALRLQPMLREMEELLRAGKFDEVLQRAERVRDVAKDNPRVMALIERAMGERKSKRESAPRDAASPGEAEQRPRVKIQHLREAADHLNAAGYEKLAALARAEIGRIEAAARRQQAERQQAQRRGDSSPDSNTAMKAELEQLRREMQELRNQLRRLKADAAPQHPPMPPHQNQPPPPKPPLERPQ